MILRDVRPYAPELSNFMPLPSCEGPSHPNALRVADRLSHWLRLDRL